MLRSRIGLTLLALLTCASSSAQEIRLEVDVDTVFVGERFNIAVVTVDPAGREVIFPDPDSAAFSAGDAVILSLKHRSFRFPEGQATGVRVDSAVYETAVFAVDTAVVGGFPIRFIETSGDTTDAMAPYGLVPVFSVVPDSAQGIYDLAPLALFPRNWLLWILAGMAILAALVLARYVYSRWRRSKQKDTTPDREVRENPYWEALVRLKKLADAPSPDSPETVKEYYVELSDIVRTYLELRISVPALEQTTSELEATLERLTGISSDLISSHSADRILESLLLADLAKFAQHLPLDSQNETALKDVRQSIDSIERARIRREALEAQAHQED